MRFLCPTVDWAARAGSLPSPCLALISSLASMNCREAGRPPAVTVNEKGTEIRFDSDRAGTSAAHLYYRKACDLGPAVSIPSDQEEADAFENVRQIVPSFHGSRYYVFPGGCVWWDFEFDGGVSATRSVELGDSLELVGRDILNGRIRRTFVDAEL